MSPGRVVIVGASASGLTVAQTLRREGYSGPVTLIGAEQHPPYDRPPLSKQLLSGVWDVDQIALRRSYDDLDVRLELGVVATGLDVDASRVLLGDGREIDFDALVIATGTRARELSDGHQLSGVHVLRTLDDALALRSDLTPGRRLVVVGAGYLGTEVAATAVGLGCAVSIVDPLPVPVARPLGPVLGDLVAALHARHGVDLLLGIGVNRVLGDGAAVTGVELADGRVLPADALLVAIGATPDTDWLAGSGLSLENGVVCDAFCRATPAIYAAGDVARWLNPRFGRLMRVEHRMNATEQGMAVARNLMGRDEPFAPIPYFWTDQYDVKIQAYGIFPPDGEFQAGHGEPGDPSFTRLCVEDSRVVGAVGWNAPRELRTARGRIEASGLPVGSGLG